MTPNSRRTQFESMLVTNPAFGKSHSCLVSTSLNEYFPGARGPSAQAALSISAGCCAMRCHIISHRIDTGCTILAIVLFHAIYGSVWELCGGWWLLLPVFLRCAPAAFHFISFTKSHILYALDLNSAQLPCLRFQSRAARGVPRLHLDAPPPGAIVNTGIAISDESECQHTYEPCYRGYCACSA